MNKRSAEESKRVILAAARTVFAEQGYARANMRDIAQVAGISVGGLYLYFKNKEDLYQTFMLDWTNKLNDRTHEALAQLADPVAAIKAFITISIDFARTHKEIFILQGREWGFTFGVERQQDFFSERRRIIANIVRKGMEMGLFRTGDADGTARVIFNILRGFAVSLVIDEDALFAAEDCVDLVLHGLLRRNEE
ncbi:MAG TPA: TetR/AcrR family transcriptional regulator [Geobacteraceae bacterium]|nr:TetR/AcrR family transcriptional regulator [Geobacteraceae bacterium]